MYSNRRPSLLYLVVVWIVVCPVGLAHETFVLQPNEVVAFLGGTNVVNMQNDGHLEALLTAANSNCNPRFLDLAWEGDTVYRQGTVIERWRKDKFGDLSKQLSDLAVTCVFVQFGQSEALDGAHKRAEFAEAFDRMLTVCREGNRRGRRADTGSVQQTDWPSFARHVETQ